MKPAQARKDISFRNQKLKIMRLSWLKSWKRFGARKKIVWQAETWFLGL